MTISVGHGKGKASQLQTSPSSHVFCFTGYKLRKTDPESSNYLRYRRGNVFPYCDCFCPPFWKRDAADNLSRTRNVHDFWQWIGRLRRPTGNYFCRSTSLRATFSWRNLFSFSERNAPVKANPPLHKKRLGEGAEALPADRLPPLMPNIFALIH